MYYQDWIAPYPEDYEYGYYPSAYDIREIYIENGEEGIPNEGRYNLIRTEGKLVWTDDADCYLERDD